MRAIMAVVLNPLLPAEPATREERLTEAMTALDDYLAYMSPPIQRQARMSLAALHMWPVRRGLLGTSSPWREIAPERIEAFLLRAHDSRFFLMRRLYDFVQSMSVLAWFDLPAAWGEIGYPGPPVERPARSGELW